ncbi:MAG TPA: PKD domain-containing protein, partial [Planctomycetota bacterium]|nr:PKD domain-containing protein [Planctomycetota bacterium]
MRHHSSLGAAVLLSAFALVSAAHAANDKAQANAYDNNWESAWVLRARALYASGTGKTAGFVLQIGDSITFSSAYASWAGGGAGKTSEDSALCTWAKTNINGANGQDTTCKNGFFLGRCATSANRGMTASGGIAAYEILAGSGNGGTAMPADGNPTTARTKIADGTTYVRDIHIETLAAAFNDAGFAVVMLGTNDMSAGRTPSQFITDLSAIVDKLEAQRIVVILSTIPPSTHANGGNVPAYNTAIRNLAQARGLPLIDYYAEILARRPGTTWQNTLIDTDGVHPTGVGGSFNSGSDPYASGGNSATHTTGDACANVGYLLRSWLTVQKLKEVKSYVVDGAAVASPSGPVGDPQIKTDHTYYQGELAYSTLPRLVASALNTPGRPTTGNTARDNVLKLWYWRVEHYYHHMSPAEYLLPGVTPSPSADNPLMTAYDCLSQQFSYGYGLCGTNHGTIRPILETAGFESRRRGLYGDTGHEVKYNGRWAMMNTDSVSMISLTNSTTSDFASVDEIINNVNLLQLNPLNLPQYTAGGTSSKTYAGTHSPDWYFYYEQGFPLAPLSSTNAGKPMYAEGYQARPIQYELKRGEKFTRFKDRDGIGAYLGETGYRYWGSQLAGGPFRDWSHVGKAPALPTPPNSNGIGNNRYGNGLYEWSPEISTGEFLDGVSARDVNVVFDGTSPKLRALSGTGKVTLKFFSPYVIVAKPSDGVDPALAGATGGAWIVPNAVGSVPVEVSVNNGATWTSLGNLSGTTKLDFTDHVKGRYSYLLRLTVSNTAGLDGLQLRTAVMIAEGVWPWLKDSNSTITYAAGGTGVVEVIPDYSSQTAADTFKVADSGNVTFSAMNASNTFAYTSTNNQPCFVTYRVSAPPGKVLTKIHGAADASIKVYPDAGGSHHSRLWVSTDNGATFTKFGEYKSPDDGQLSHGWSYGSADVSAAGVNNALVKVEFYNNGWTARLRYVRLYGEYSQTVGSNLKITHLWDDAGGAGKTFTHTVPAGSTSSTYTVPTSTGAVHKRITFEVPSGGAPPPPPPPVLTTIVVTPNGTNVQAGSSVSFTATAYDQNGVAMSPQPSSYTWTTPAGTGTGSSPRSVTAPTTAGSTFTVSASASGKTGSATNTVIASTTLGSIVVSPSSATLNPGQQRQFSASAKDPYGNTLATQPTFTWTATGGTITTGGLYTAGGTAGSSFSATASAGGKSGSASITINSTPPVLTTITVTPNGVTLQPGNTQQYTAVAKDQFGNLMSPQPSFTWTQMGGSITSGGLYTAGTTLGNFSVTASAGGKSGSANLTISSAPNQPPVINSAGATPSPATVNSVVTFTGAASDPENSTLAYSWNFGDGSSATGSTTTHVYTVTGEYTITLTVTDGNGAYVTRTFSLFVGAGGAGGGGGGGGGTPPGGDNDGDGFSNEDEDRNGTDKNDPNSKPGGGGDKDGDGIPDDVDLDDDNDGVTDSQEIADGTNPYDATSVKAQPLTVTKVSGSVKVTPGADSASVSGTILNLPKGYKTQGVVLELNVGGAVETFKLDSRGRGKSAQGSISLSLKPSLRDKLTKQLVFQGGNVAFKAKIAKGTWSDDWSDEGINT